VSRTFANRVDCRYDRQHFVISFGEPRVPLVTLYSGPRCRAKRPLLSLFREQQLQSLPQSSSQNFIDKLNRSTCLQKSEGMAVSAFCAGAALLSHVLCAGSVHCLKRPVLSPDMDMCAAGQTAAL